MNTPPANISNKKRPVSLPQDDNHLLPSGELDKILTCSPSMANNESGSVSDFFLKQTRQKCVDKDAAMNKLSLSIGNENVQVSLIAGAPE